MLIHPERWKFLRDRYQEDRPHRMLSLDGGGIRGLITKAFLRESRSSYKRRLDGNLKNTVCFRQGCVVLGGTAVVQKQ